MKNSTYLQRTKCQYWNLSDAINEIMTDNEMNFESAASKLRSELDKYDNNICMDWKTNWRTLINNKRGEFHHTPNSSNNIINNSSAVNNINCQNASTTITPTKRGVESNVIEKKNKHQKVIKEPPNDPFNHDEAYIDEEEEEEETGDDEDDEIEDDNEPLEIEQSLIINAVDVTRKLNEWVKASKYIPKLENQDLLRYNVIDCTPDSSSHVKALLDKEWDLFSASLVQHYSTYTDSNSINNKIGRITRNCRTLSLLYVSYKEHKLAIKAENCPDLLEALKLIKIFTKLKIRNTNRITDKRQTEMGYVLHFIAPIVCTILEKQEYFDLIWGESALEAQQQSRDFDLNDSARRSSATKIDLKIDILDETGTFISNFFLLEVSGPPHIKNHSHYKKDKKKIGKSLKFMLNFIYSKYPGSFEEFKNIKLYGVQIYNNTFFVYSLCLMHPRLYTFQLEKKFLCPTSGLEICNIPTFITNILEMKKNVIESLESVLVYIQNHDEQKKDDTIIAAENMSPQKK